MFDIAWTEILVIATLAIIVVGPKELPGMLRAFGKTFGQVRRTAREFQSTFNDALREAERQAAIDDIKKEVSEVSKLNPVKGLKGELDAAKDAFDSPVDAEKPLPKPAQKTPAAPATATATPPAAPEPPAAGGTPGKAAPAEADR
ncbi:MAG: Sec-independent protein translocase protein TatB [Pseudomonadota bacterium]